MLYCCLCLISGIRNAALRFVSSYFIGVDGCCTVPHDLYCGVYMATDGDSEGSESEAEAEALCGLILRGPVLLSMLIRSLTAVVVRPRPSTVGR